MSASVHEGSLHVTGTLTAGDLVPPAGSIDNAAVQAGAAGNFVDATKVEQGFALPYKQVTGTAIIAAAAEDIHVVRGTTGEVVGLKAAITGVIATGADRTVTVDLHKSTGGGAFATVLSATVVLDNTNTLRVSESATMLTTGAEDLVAGDILRVVVTVAGSAGNQAQGLIVSVHLREDPL